MNGSSILADTHGLCLSLPSSNANHHVIPCQSCVPCNVRVGKVRTLDFKVSHSWPSHASRLLQQRKVNGFVVECASWGLVTELERELEAEMNPQGEDDEEKASIGMARFRHKCGERKGVLELLECLEREAIMGEDVGKEPIDYNRRAQIFDRSSRVFQALKESKNNDVLSQQSP